MQKDPVTHARTRGLAGVMLVVVTLACAAFPSASSARARDTDGDRLTDRYEKRSSKTNPRKRDTDGDRLSDAAEVRRTKTNPRRRDTDRDGLSDAVEVRRTKTNPRRKDTDGDGVADSLEILFGRDPLAAPVSRGLVIAELPPAAELPPTAVVAAPQADVIPPAGGPVAVAPDTTPPNTSITSGPSGTVTGGGAAFEFASSEAGSTFECRVDSAPWGPCVSPAAYSDLAAGAHTFRVRATDAAGNIDGSPAQRTWTFHDSGGSELPAPTAAFSYAPASPEAGQEVTFDAGGSTCAAGPCTYSWHDVNGGTFSLGSGASMFVTFQNVGAKHVRLTVTDELGRSAQTQQTVTVSESSEPPPPPPTGECDLNATPSTFASQVSAAQAGQAICLATGNYGTWSGAGKAIVVRPQEDATPTMKVSFSTDQGGLVLEGMSGMGAPSDIRGTAGNFTIRNSMFTSKFWIRRSSGTTTPITLDGNTHNDISGVESRFGVYGGGTGVVVRNSLFQGGGSDGVRIASAGSVIGPGNRFIGFEITDSNHTDPIQFFSGLPGFVGGTRITGNYFAQPEGTGDVVAYIAAWDGTSNNVIDNNVFRAVEGGSGGGHGIAYSIALYADRGSVIRNNTMERGTCNHNIRCGTIMLASKSGYGPGTGTVIRDNVMSVVGTGSGSSYTAEHNLTQGSLAGTGNVSGTPAFVGPATAWDGFRLASGSPGRGTASDGGDPGIR
jgi:hypothetical protein